MKTSGFQPGDMVIVAGRPSMGKTAFALNIAEHVALESKLPVAIFSMEMPGTQLAMRFLSSVGRLDQAPRAHRPPQRRRMAAHDLRPGQAARGADPHRRDAGAEFDRTARPRRRLYRQCGKLGLIVIDYLQLMSSVRDGENRATELSEISRSVKALAKELHVPVVALSQLSRNVESRPNKRPVMSDLRESGAIEQDADVIVAIYRDEVYNPDSPDKGSAEINILKQRNGPIGSVRVTFLGEYTRFENFAAAGSY
ncbi:MAG: replicative DNA helicase [Rhodocyclaceae bacterium]